MDLREEYEKETEDECFVYMQRYAGARVEKKGFSDEYVEWLEAKVKNLGLFNVRQQRELLIGLLEYEYDDYYAKTTGKSIKKVVEDYLANL